LVFVRRQLVRGLFDLSSGYWLSAVVHSHKSQHPAITMPKYAHFEDLPVWKEAARLYNLVLDLLEAHGSRFSHGYRNQIDRAGLSVSNNIAEGFDRITTSELIDFLGYARGSSSEVQSMSRVVRQRAGVRPAGEVLDAINEAAASCIRQISGWVSSIEEGGIKGKRHLTGQEKRIRKQSDSARSFRQNWLAGLKPEHALYHTPEARRARGKEG
jgi:four helix bundle protein